MKIIAFMSIGVVRNALLKNGYVPGSAELRQLDSVPDGQDIVMLADGTMGYYDKYGDFEVLLYPGQLDSVSPYII